MSTRGVLLSPLTTLIRYAGDFLVYLVVFFTHESLDGEHGLVRIGYGLPFCGVAHFLSPSLVNATTEGVVLWPSLLMMTVGSLPSMTATQLLVVPKSIR